MLKKKILVAAVAVSTVILTGCGPVKVADTTPTPVPEAEFAPTSEELKAQMKGSGSKIVLSAVEYSDSAAKSFAPGVYDDFSQRLLKSGNTLVDRTLAAKLEDELRAAEVSGKFQTSGPADADIAIMTKISDLSLKHSFTKEYVWVDEDGERHKRDSYCRFTSGAKLFVRAYKIPSMDLVNTYDYEGSATMTSETGNSNCPINDATASSLVNEALEDAVKSGSGETLNDLAPEAYVLERRDNEDASKALFRVTIAKKSGAVEGAKVKFYRKTRTITPITNEERMGRMLLGEGEISGEGIDTSGSYVYVKDKELIQDIKIGDIAKLDHGKCDVDETEVLGSCIKIPGL
ncbi:hypothetical protein J9B83_13630 [Marinomonas sp. A79]|uniref:Lipoprotein n=1 Tax=Marinomonas vulgaris TaxID=2823372 RepID=A0ABS5HES0_9GAMM|nr:hypothetical protein [Marinomonas vulgaris]MBR7889954.1 hypothetical protein [Marinomonas vulgaris]